MSTTMHAPEVRSIWAARKWFEVLQTGEKSQTAVMTLAPGKPSGAEPEIHGDSEQVLVVMEGEIEAQIGEEIKTMRVGDVIIIQAGTKHRFVNRGPKPAVTFNVYSPAEYSSE